MKDKPNIWHYGLMAERWGKFIHDAPEVPYFIKEIARFGEPVLDLACGTGRVLIPLLQAGIDIDGCDVSGDMLHYCRERAIDEDFNPDLFEQPMHAFDLPRKYKTIFICGSFGLAGSREKDLQTLQRCYDHLLDDGALLFNIQAEYTSSESWNEWLKEYRDRLPEPWPKEGNRREDKDGSESIAYFRILSLNPLEQSLTRQVRLEKVVNGELIATEEYTLFDNMYFMSEVLLMLKVAGFKEISVYGNYTENFATADHKELNFVAIK